MTQYSQPSNCLKGRAELDLSKSQRSYPPKNIQLNLRKVRTPETLHKPNPLWYLAKAPDPGYLTDPADLDKTYGESKPAPHPPTPLVGPYTFLSVRRAYPGRDPANSGLEQVGSGGGGGAVERD